MYYEKYEPRPGICLHCGRTFLKRSPNAKFCSPRCGKWYRRKHPTLKGIKKIGEFSVTGRVAKRISSHADYLTLRTTREKIIEFLTIAQIMLAIFTFFGFWIGMNSWTGFIYGLCSAGVLIGSTFLYRPTLLRVRKRIEDKGIELAGERYQRIIEKEQFYASPEWKALRDRIIKGETVTCSHCRRKIKRVKDVTVDHIKPRSKFPELALEITNLQVLCRKCNSAKGNR